MKRFMFLVLLLCLASMAFADTQVIDFEQQAAYTQITNQYAGLTFSNALQLVAPSYDYFDYPPHSGFGVITNDPDDPIGVGLYPNVESVGGWYTDPNGVTVTAYDQYGNVLDMFSGGAVYGSNAWFSVSSAGAPIASITISDDLGDPDGVDSLTVDDLTITTPEPGSLALLGSGLAMALGTLRRKIKA